MSATIDISRSRWRTPKKELLARFVWNLVWTVFARPLPRAVGSGWKCFLLRCFGAKIGTGAVVYASAIISAPWRLEMGDGACIADGVIIENAERVIIGKQALLSQRVSLYTASHDIAAADFPRVAAPIIIGDYAWVAAEALIMKGVTIGEGAVVGARAAVFKDVPPWTVVGGNPARFIKNREIRHD